MSSVMPYVRSRGAPPPSTSCAASTTSLSTQPPETEPASSPLSLTTSFEPTGPRRRAARGDDGRDGDLLAPGVPAIDVRQQLLHRFNGTHARAGRVARAARDVRPVAEQYEAARPTYPEALLDDLVALARIPPAGASLEIGPGTGKAQRRPRRARLRARGGRARRRARGGRAPPARERPGAPIVVADFERWEPAAADFDAVVAFTSFHWIAPGAALREERCAPAARRGARRRATRARAPAGRRPGLGGAAGAIYDARAPRIRTTARRRRPKTSATCARRSRRPASSRRSIVRQASLEASTTPPTSTSPCSADAGSRDRALRATASTQRESKIVSRHASTRARRTPSRQRKRQASSRRRNFRRLRNVARRAVSGRGTPCGGPRPRAGRAALPSSTSRPVERT